MNARMTQSKIKSGLQKKETTPFQQMQTKINKQFTNHQPLQPDVIQEKLQKYNLNKINQNVHIKLNINNHVNMKITLNKLPQNEKNIALPVSIKPQVIPLNIFQTWHTLDLPENMRKAVNTLKTQNSEFTHYLYDDNMCREFIKNNFSNDVLYAYDKLKPGAYKADLWRYCVLYIYGGIYLDIKMVPENNFKLINLTCKEFYPKDIVYNNVYGIWQGLLVSLPNNDVLYKSILQIALNVKNNYYGNNTLCITGPQLINRYVREDVIKNSEITFGTLNNGTTTALYYNGKVIMKSYKEYRIEQNTSATKYYAYLWENNCIYNYATLKSINTIVLTRTINKIINGKNIKLFASNPAIIKDPNDNNQYIVNIRWINYEYNENGSKKVIPKQWISLNSRFIMNSQFKQMTDEIFLQEDYKKEQYYSGIGLEDIRLFNYLGVIYFSSTYFDNKRHILSSCCGRYNFNLRGFKLDRNIILPSFYDVNNNKRVEKNWSYMIYNGDLMMVYNWYPLIISKPNFNNNTLNAVKTVLMPDFFKIIRGSTPGYAINDEIWFVVHTSRKAINNKNMHYNYQHCFVIFNSNMELVRYSELFKFDDCFVEFCIGLIIEETRTILSYSSLDTNSKIGVYDNEYLKNGIKWFDNNANTIQNK
jgi:mannosyltransferase OCH1-like enzyme